MEGDGACTVVVVDDSVVQRRAIAEPLRQLGHEVLEATSAAEARAIVDASVPDVVLLDLDLPDDDGLVLLARIRAGAAPPAVIIVSGRVGVSDVAAGLNAGAHDYLRKPAATGELVARVAAAARAKRWQDEARSRHDVLEQALRTDPVTGIANRVHLEEHLLACVNLSRRHGTPFALLCLDVDRFKDINDRDGHAGGDRVLRDVAHAVGGCLRVEDLVGRWGGDEFLVLLLGASAADVLAPAGRILAAVRAVSRPGGAGAPVTVSIGAAVHDRDEAGGTLLSRADSALYAAKASGRDTVVVAQRPRGGSPADPVR